MKDIRITKDPRTFKYTRAEWIKDYFGLGIFGVKFPDGTIYNPQAIPCKVRRIIVTGNITNYERNI